MNFVVRTSLLKKQTGYYKLQVELYLVVIEVISLVFNVSSNKIVGGQSLDWNCNPVN